MTGVAIFTFHSRRSYRLGEEIPGKPNGIQGNFPALPFSLLWLQLIFRTFGGRISGGKKRKNKKFFESTVEYSRSVWTITAGPFFFIWNDVSREYRATLFVNILLSYISCLTEISNVSKEKTETAKHTANISRRAAGRYTHGFCRPHRSRHIKAMQTMRKMYQNIGGCMLFNYCFRWRDIFIYLRLKRFNKYAMRDWLLL